MTELTGGNRIELLQSGIAYFPALEAACDAATLEIHLETYIFADDATGRRIRDALVRAARRGVAVRVLVDGFGSRDLDSAWIRALRDAGVRMLTYRPKVSPWTLRRARLRRLHRKIAVIDARVAFVGGINILDDFEPPGAATPRFDFAVRVEGPLVGEIHGAARRLWGLVTATQLRASPQYAREPEAQQEPRGTQRAAFIVRDNFRHRRAIEQSYLSAIADAQSEILISNAYFFPGRTFRRALAEAASRGVRVILLLQGRVEYVLQHYASRALYGSFLDAGIFIHEYQRAFLHAKVAVIDRRWATVGSSNIDPFSLLLAREANVVIEDGAFAAQLREALLKAVADGATRVRQDRWRDQPLGDRVFTWACYGLARFLTGVFAYGQSKEYT